MISEKLDIEAPFTKAVASLPVASRAPVAAINPALEARVPTVEMRWVQYPQPCKIAEITHVGEVHVADIRQIAGPDQGYAAWKDAGGAVEAYNRPFGRLATIRGVIIDAAARYYKVSYSSDGIHWEPILAQWTEKRGCWPLTIDFPRDSRPDGWLTIEPENRGDFLGCGWNGRLIGWDPTVWRRNLGGWNTSPLADGKYMLKLTVRYGGAGAPTRDSIPVYVQVDNTKPEICFPFKNPIACESYKGKILVRGGVYDEHFNQYRLSFQGGEIRSPIEFKLVRWNEGYPGVDDKGTGIDECDVELGIWNPREDEIRESLHQMGIDTLKECCYSILMRARDRSILNDDNTQDWRGNYAWAEVTFSYSV